jgi:hypothetical protein
LTHFIKPQKSVFAGMMATVRPAKKFLNPKERLAASHLWTIQITIMKINLTKFFGAGGWLFAAMPLPAQNYMKADPHGFSDSDLNAALGISDAWIWLQNSIVPLTMLAIFLGAIIIIAELYYRQNKILNETLRLMAEMNRQSLKSMRE